MIHCWSFLLACVQLVLQLHMGEGETATCVQQGELDFRADPGNCSVFYRCDGTVLYKFPCSPGLVFSTKINACVFTGSDDDTCTSTSNPIDELNPICQESSDTLIPHGSKCSLYYNCSAPTRHSMWEKNLQECNHPQVYNPDTRRCEHYSMVNCGQREMPLGPCDYKISECPVAHCRPCEVGSPSCRNISDGLNADPDRPFSPYFIVCVEQRLVYWGQCISTPSGVQIFDPERKSCRLYQNRW